MLYIEDYRASKILYNFLISNKFSGVFLLPANVCPIVPITFIEAGVKFQMVDIDKNNLCIDQQTVLNLLESKETEYIGLFFVRTYGIEDSFEKFFKKVKLINKQIVIIDDKCLSKPSFNTPLTEAVDLYLYSTGYAKYIDLGIGAFAYFNNSSNLKYKKQITSYIINDEASILTDFNQIPQMGLKKFINKKHKWLDNKELTSNYKTNVIESVKTVSVHKKQLNTIYSDIIPKEFILENKYQNWRFNIRVAPQIKDKILTKLFANKLFASSHYAPLAHIFDANEAKVSEDVHQTIINLFNDFYYSKDQAIETAKIVKSVILQN